MTLTKAQARQVVFDRASEINFPACEAMVPGVCSCEATHWHHRKLRSQGGGDEASSTLAVCHLCHDYLHKHTGEAYEKGWLVHAWADPLGTPLYRRGEWVMLDNEGGYTLEMKGGNDEP